MRKSPYGPGASEYFPHLRDTRRRVSWEESQMIVNEMKKLIASMFKDRTFETNGKKWHVSNVYVYGNEPVTVVIDSDDGKTMRAKYYISPYFDGYTV